MLNGKKLIHHGRTCRYRHSVNVARVSLLLADKLRIRVRYRDMVRGALLHDYYLYDRRVDRPRRHLRSHAEYAHENADAEFSLTPIERDIIRNHMFPITLTAPKSREGRLVCVADKLCTVGELLGLPSFVH